MKFLEKTVAPVALWGCELMHLNSNTLREMEAVQREMWRRTAMWPKRKDFDAAKQMVWSRKQTKNLMQGEKTESWARQALKRQWTWAGKIGRREGERDTLAVVMRWRNVQWQHTVR